MEYGRGGREYGNNILHTSRELVNIASKNKSSLQLAFLGTPEMV